MDEITAYVIGVLFVATLVRSTFGFGEALVAVPLLALCVPVEVAVPVAALLSVVVAAGVLAQDARLVDKRSAAWLIATTAIGIPLGLLVLRTVDERVVKIALASVILLFSGWSLLARTRPRLGESRAPLAAAGFVSGVLGGAYGMNGPPLVVYGALRGWDPRQFRATLQAYFLPASLAGVIGYGASGLLTTTVWRDLAWCAPGTIVALVIGRALNRRLETRTFVRWVHGGLIAIALGLVAQSLVRG